MVDGLGVHGLDEADVVGDARNMRQNITVDPGSGVAVLLHFEGSADQGQAGLVSGHRGEALPHTDRSWELLARVRLQLRLPVVKVNLRGSACLKQKNDSLRLWRGRLGLGRFRGLLSGHEVRKGKRSQTHSK